MASSKPVLLVIHGAWHQPLHYASLISPLRRAGYTVATPELRSTGSDERAIAGKTLADDADAVARSLDPFLDEGREVVLVCHSYGGLVASEVAPDRTVQARAKTGAKGGIRGLVFISALLFAEPGHSSWTAFMGSGSFIPPWLALRETHSEVIEPMALYAGVDKPLAEVCAFVLRKQSLASAKAPSLRVASEIEARKIFVVCSAAAALPVEGQLAVAKAAGAEVETLDAGHWPFLEERNIDELLRIIKSV